MRYHDRLPSTWTGVVVARFGGAALAQGPTLLTLLAHGRPLVPHGISLPPGAALPQPGSPLTVSELDLDEPVDLSVHAAPLDREAAHASLPAVDPVFPARLRAFVDGCLRGEADPLPLCGLGPGSTPLGDDLMVGVIAGLWRLSPPLVPRLGDLRHRTTPTSAEMLRHACANAFPEPLAALANALGTPAPPVEAMLEVGATSGRAMLAGLASVLRRGGPGGLWVYL